MKTFVVLISGILLASPALAQTSAGSMSASVADPTERNDAPETRGESGERSADGERRICRRVDSDPSSRLSARRVCRTAAEWRQVQRSN